MRKYFLSILTKVRGIERKTMNTRREFIRKSSWITSGTLLIPTAFACKDKRPVSSNGLINVAMIGLGGHGLNYNLKHFLKWKDLCRVVAVCDVYKPLAEKAKKMVDQAYGILMPFSQQHPTTGMLP